MIDTLFDWTALLSSEESPCHLRGRDPGAFAGLISVDEFQALGRAVPDSARMIRRGERVGPSGRPSELWIGDGLRAGATLLITDLAQHDTRLGALAVSAAANLGCPVQLNGYLTPPGSRGNDVHFDDHDVIVLQLHGQKRWTLYDDRPVSLPVLPHRRVLDPAELHQPCPLLLEAGDVLYIPRGVPHEACTGEAASLHVSIGLHPALVRDALIALVDVWTMDELSMRRRFGGDAAAIAEQFTRLADNPRSLAALCIAARDLVKRRYAPVPGPFEKS